MGKELPYNWVETELGNLITLKNGFAFKSKEYIKEGIPIIRMSDIVYGEIDLKKAARVKEKKEYDRYIIEKGDILIGMSGSIGKYGIYDLDEKVYLNQRVGNLRLTSENLIDKTLIYYIVGNIQREIVEKAHGGTVPNISGKDIESTVIGLPPLKEQKRIVAKLDTLFEHIENTKTRLKKVPTLLKNFRQAVLTQAVTGKLTEQWKQKEGFRDWKYERAEDVCELITKGTTPKSGGLQEKGAIPFLKVYNIVDQKVDFNYRPQFISKEINENVLKRSIVRPGAVIMNIVGPPLGKVAIIPADYPEWNLNQALAVFRPLDCLISNFVYCILREGTPIDKISQDFKGVVGQSNISLAQCRDFIFPLPSVEEQTEIVRRVESLFAKADAIEAKYKLLKEKIDNIPQTILSKAFKGELVAQLESDGDARELLKEIKKLRLNGKKKK